MNEFFDAELVAKMCHAANNAWEKHFMMDRPGWNELSDEKKYGYRRMVELFSGGCSEREVHQAFLLARVDNGWKLGDRNDAQKLDPFLLPYDQLCAKMQLRYHLFKNIVETFRKG
jgi:hypothetical protein